MDATHDHPTLRNATGLAQARPGLLLPQLAFDPVKLRDLPRDPACLLRSLVFRFVKALFSLRPAACQDEHGTLPNIAPFAQQYPAEMNSVKKSV